MKGQDGVRATRKSSSLCPDPRSDREPPQCLFFLDHLQPGESITLLKERYDLVAHERVRLVLQMQDLAVQDDAHKLVNDHKLTLLDAELNWLARTIMHLQTRPAAAHPRAHASVHHAHHVQNSLIMQQE